MARIALLVTSSLFLSLRVFAADTRTPIAVMDLQGRGVDEAAAGALTTEVSNTLATLRVFRVITREDIKRMVQLQQTKQACTGNIDAACMAEIGGALGVDFLIYGEAAKIAETYSLSLVLLDIQKAEAANRVNRKITEARALLPDTASATKLLVQPLLESKKGFLVLDVREKGAKVTVDGRTIGFTPLPGRLELAMGAHEVLIEKEGFLAFARTIDVQPNQATVEPIGMVPSQEFIDHYEAGASRLRIIAWIAAGAAVALAGTAAVLKLVDDARFDDLKNKRYLEQGSSCADLNPSYNGTDFCPTSLGYQNNVVDKVSSIERTDTIALGALFAALASGLVSAYLFATGDAPGRYEAYGAQPKVVATPKGLSLGFDL
jgi:TolB-like protein